METALLLLVGVCVGALVWWAWSPKGPKPSWPSDLIALKREEFEYQRRMNYVPPPPGFDSWRAKLDFMTAEAEDRAEREYAERFAKELAKATPR
jgi:hypothetical protein